jgi:glutamate dehydrogenase (NAD(P)+)
MTWIKDTYMSVKGETDINGEGCCTGKYISQGGIAGRSESTGLGVYFGLRELMSFQTFQQAAKLTPGLRGKTFIMQGFGNVGYWAAKFFHNDGAKITTIIEYNSAIHNPEGLNPDEVHNYFKSKGTLEGFPKAKMTETKNPMSYISKQADFLVPASVEKSINKHNADSINVKVVVEGANGPTTFAGEEILTKKGILVCPDLLMNAGGVTCSYFEWLKNIDHVSPGKLSKRYDQNQQMNLLKIMGYSGGPLTSVKGAEEIDIVYSGLEEYMCSAVKTNWEMAVDKKLLFRDACLVNGIYKVYDAYKDCGISV